MGKIMEIGKDGKRLAKIGKDRKKWKKMGKDRKRREKIGKMGRGQKHQKNGHCFFAILDAKSDLSGYVEKVWF